VLKKENQSFGIIEKISNTQRPCFKMIVRPISLYFPRKDAIIDPEILNT